MDPAHAFDLLMQEAVAAIDSGDLAMLERLIEAHPELLRDRLATPGAWLRDRVGDALEGFFERPYLLWFVAEDPVRNGTLPANIADVTRALIHAAELHRVESLPEQVDYALRLTAWSWIARDCGVQIDLIDALLDAGASPNGKPDDALINGNLAAASHLLERGATLTLPTALVLERWDDVTGLAHAATPAEKQFAFVLAALRGKARALERMIELGSDSNTPSAHLYSHATPLHHAVCSGSLEAVRVLMAAGADLQTKDTVWNATPLGWAEYYLRENAANETAGHYARIAEYLRDSDARVQRDS